MSEFLLNPLIDIHSGSFASLDQAGMSNALTFLLPLIAALVISMAIIPVMVRLAPILGMIDKPDARKVHIFPIPRVGGVGIVIGTLVPLSLLLPVDLSLAAYFFGALTLLCFGVWDDSRELGHYVKFAGQFAAVIAVVYFGDVFVTYLPFMGHEPVPESFGKPFTVFAMVGMINAINHSDGLDGLAGGESLMSLSGIAWLSYMAGGEVGIIISLATIGGLLGFLRFNTHPARIFMGDGGSQFLGFTLGYLAVLLTQNVNQALSPALPLLILGLPIADIIAVFIQRIYKKMNWFKATRNHIHHRLLDLGFRHHESVIIVYSVQAFLVMCAMIMPYGSDAQIIGIYLAVVLSIFLLLYIGERSGWHMHESDEKAVLDEVIESAKREAWLGLITSGLVYFGISAFLVAGAFFVLEVPSDFTLISGVLCVLLLLRLLLGYRIWMIPLRLLVYVTIAFVVYLLNSYQPAYLSGVDPLTYGFFGVIVASIALSLRFSKESNFSVTPMDFLVLLAVLALVTSTKAGIVDSRITAMVLKLIILFYGAELILKNMSSRWNIFTGAVLLALFVVCARGVMANFL